MFLKPYILQLTKVNHCFVEEYIHTQTGESGLGNFVKWTNNWGYVNNKEAWGKLAFTFCHFSYHYTKGECMIVDIQGWHDKLWGTLFTDPQVHTKAQHGESLRKSTKYQLYGMGNLGVTGMAKFFQSHVCSNCFCRQFKLPKPPIHFRADKIDDCPVIDGRSKLPKKKTRLGLAGNQTKFG